MTEMLPISTDKGLRLSQLRIDVDRDTHIRACPNINGHIHITLGRGRDATLILHPHAAKRLIAAMNEVLTND